MILLAALLFVIIVATIYLLYRHRQVPHLQQLNFSTNKYITYYSKIRNSMDNNDTMPLQVMERPGKLQCYNPATAEYLGEVDAMTPYEVDTLVANARVAQVEWSKTNFATRRHFLRILLRAIIDYQKEISTVCVKDSGKTMLGANFGEVIPSLEKIQWVLDNGENVLKTQFRTATRLMFYKNATVSFEPLGVLAIIAPFNYPFHNLVNHVISGLFAGNAVVIKVSEHTSYSSTFGITLIKECVKACGYDSNLVQLITGFGDAGAALVRSNIDKIIFTGSTTVGKLVMKGAAAKCTPCVLELGGKDPFIVCDDAKLSDVFALLVRGCYQNAGQNCIGVERVFVQENVYDHFLEKAMEKVLALRQGCPLNNTNICYDVGATTMQGQLNLIEELVNDAVSKGARVLVGGKRNTKLEPGLFFEPTLIVDVTNDMRIFYEEAFGPLMIVIKFSTDEDVIHMANDSDFGLGSSIFTNNRQRGHYIARNLKVGMANINDFGVNYMVQDLPFGGVRLSGYGRFGGPEGLKECCAMKSTTSNTYSWLTTSLVLPPLLDYPVQHASSTFTEGLAKFYYGIDISENINGIVKMLSCLMGLEK